MAKLQVEKRNGLFDLKPLYEWMRNALDGIYRIEVKKTLDRGSIPLGATKSSKQLLYNRLLLFFYWIAFKSAYLITPSSLPTLINAAIALSKCAFSCPADNWTLLRACPFGTTG